MPDDTASSVIADDLLMVGRVYKAHANRGEVKIIPETDVPERFDALKTVYLGRSAAQARAQAVENVRHQTTKRGPLVLLKLEGVDDRNAAEALRRQEVYIPEEALPPLEDDEAFVHDLIGLAVVDEGGTRLGTVKGVDETAAHEIFVIGREGGGEPVLVPAVEAFIREIDFENERLVVRPIEGMF